MFSRHMEPFRETFVDQFQQDGDAYLFRKALRGAAIRVTAAERDAFIADFDKSLRRSTRIFVLAIVAITLVAIGGAVALELAEPWMTIAITAPFIVALATFVTVIIRSYGAPARSLAHRVAIAPPLTRSDARKMALDQLRWSHFASFAALFAVATWQIHINWDITRGWGRIWLVLAAVMAIGIAVQAYRKWRHDRKEPL